MIAAEGGRVNIDAEDRIEKLLSIPTCDGYCARGGKPAHLRSLKSPERERVVRFACKSWSCRICATWLRLKAGLHYGIRILRSVGSLYSKRVTAADWGNERKRMYDRRADWVRVGTLVIRCEPCEDDADTAYPDGEEVVKRLGHELRALEGPPVQKGTRFRPIDCSAGWRAPKKQERYEWLGWATTCDPDAVLSVLRNAGIEGGQIKTRPGTEFKLFDVFFQCPADRREEVEWRLQH